ncbi:MAG: MarR family transcriptional regulator [Sphingomonas sp.]
MAQIGVVVVDRRAIAHPTALASAAYFLGHFRSLQLLHCTTHLGFSVAIYKHAYYVAAMTETLGFLIADISRRMRKHFDERARSSGATGAQWRTLKILDRHEGINQGQLAELLEVEPITACRMIDRLEESGLVERRRDPGDRRAWRIFATDKAGPVLADLHVVSERMIEELLQGLNARQREELIRSLNVVRSNLTNSNESKEAAHG